MHGTKTGLFTVEAGKAVRTGDWGPFVVKVETLTAGRVATALVAFTFSMLAASPLGILGYGLIMAITSALIDEKLVGQVNDAIFK